MGKSSLVNFLVNRKVSVRMKMWIRMIMRIWMRRRIRVSENDSEIATVTEYKNQNEYEIVNIQ